jgi:hypothetical protein
MGPTALLLIWRKECCGFLLPLKIHRLGRAWTRDPFIQFQRCNHYTTEAKPLGKSGHRCEYKYENEAYRIWCEVVNCELRIRFSGVLFRERSNGRSDTFFTRIETSIFTISVLQAVSVMAVSNCVDHFICKRWENVNELWISKNSKEDKCNVSERTFSIHWIYKANPHMKRCTSTLVVDNWTPNFSKSR